MASDSAGIVVIGDEILNGRHRDRHFDAIGAMLRERGLAVASLQILPDEPDVIVDELRRSMDAGQSVFCCGGIGATPDDHTRGCAARAAGVELTRHAGAVAEIEARFGDEAYPNRIKMADLPAGCELIPNPYNRVPGFSIRRHYFLPGFPEMAHPMAQWVLDTDFATSVSPEQQCSVWVSGVPESELIGLMETLIERFPTVKWFSLPRLGEDYRIQIGFRGRDDLDAPMRALTEGLDAQGCRYRCEDD